MTNIYDQHKATFAQVEAYVVLDRDHERVATIAFKFPRDGAGRLYAYVHWLGLEMVRGSAAGGGGYGKRSAACSKAACEFMATERKRAAAIGEGPRPDRDGHQHSFWKALAKDDGNGWERNLRDAGFTVLQAV